jgi:hypothetical protein
MITWPELLIGVALPAAVTCGVLIAGWRLVRRRYSARDSRSWAGPLAVGAGFVAGYLGLFGRPGLPPHDAIDWLVLAAAPMVALGIVDSYYRIPPPGRVLSIAVAAPLLFLLLAWPLLSHGGHDDLPVQLVTATAVAVASLISLDLLAPRMSAGRLSAVLCAVAAPAAVVLGSSGSARLGLIATILASTQAGAMLGSVVLGRAGLGRGIVLVCGTLLAGVLWSGHLYAQLQTSDALLLAAAPNLAWLGRYATRRYGWLVHVAVQIGPVLAVAAIAAVRAWRAFAASGL